MDGALLDYLLEHAFLRFKGAFYYYNYDFNRKKGLNPQHVSACIAGLISFAWMMYFIDTVLATHCQLEILSIAVTLSQL